MKPIIFFVYSGKHDWFRIVGRNHTQPFVQRSYLADIAERWRTEGYNVVTVRVLPGEDIGEIKFWSHERLTELYA